MRYPEYYEFFSPIKIVAGKKAVGNLAFELRALNSEKPLIITDKGVSNAGLIQKAVNSFDNTNLRPAGVYDDVPQDSSVRVVNKIASIYREKKCDALIAIGGGSVLDTAKGVNILVSEDSNDLMKFTGVNRLEHPLRPYIAIPTTAGTGSEVTSAAVIANPEKNIKMGFTSPFLYPNTAILDPEMTLTLPPKLTSATGMDALTHAVEAYTCLQKNPVSDSYAMISAKLILENIEKATEKGNDRYIRFLMLNGATLAGIAFSNALVGAVHAIAHALGGVCHIPHGIANSIMLPVVMGYNINKSAKLYSEMYRFIYPNDKTVTKDEEGAKHLIEKIRNVSFNLHKLCGLPRSLKEAGVSKDKLEEVAQASINDGSIVLNPEKVTYEDSLSMLNKAFE